MYLIYKEIRVIKWGKHQIFDSIAPNWKTQQKILQ